jgi:hypothetical protein
MLLIRGLTKIIFMHIALNLIFTKIINEWKKQKEKVQGLQKRYQQIF